MSNPTREADKVIEAISTRLANGELKSGDKLPSESKLCDEFNVSRTVIREAIQQLKAIGVLETITGSGSYITEGNLGGMKNSLEFYAIMNGDPDRWVELLEIRMLLESASARKLAGEAFSKKGLNAVKKALQGMHDNKDNLKKFSELDVCFHQVLIEHAGNQILTAMLQSLSNLQLRFSKETYRDENSEQLIERNYNEHLAIVTAIENQDPDAAEAAMKNHLSATMKNLLHYIKNIKS